MGLSDGYAEYDMIKLSQEIGREKIDRHRRRFLGATATTVAAVRFSPGAV